MTVQVVVVEDAADWKFPALDVPVVHVDDYLTGKEYFAQRNLQVINLCRGYKYLSIGYYSSLLAEARRHRVIPTVKSMLDLSSKAMYGLDTADLDERIQRSLKKRADEESFDLYVFFGQCRIEGLGPVARQIFEIFPCPLLRVTFRRRGTWFIDSIRPVTLHRLRKAERDFFVEAFSAYRKHPRRATRKVKTRYDLAILHDPTDPLPPSDLRALRKFIRIGRELGVDVELINRRDYARLAEYDALFIRDTTRINHYTYRFAKKAESEGMVVIDDPTSILRCTNKVYLAELLRANRVPTPKTAILGRGDLEAAQSAIGFPMVLKVPDGSFSQGVFKAEDDGHMREIAARLFQSSELILAQEFLYTEFDWRIGILNRKPIFASQYFMSKRHWQIVKYDDTGKATEGAFRTCAVEEAPKVVVDVALKAANLIGDGLYGVDVKQNREGKAYVIEVNDNPNLECGVEDAVLKDELYRIVIGDFVRRLDLRHRNNRTAG